MGKKVVVLGSTGFIGSHLSRELHRRGFEVVGVSTGASVSASTSSLIRTHLLDITEPERLGNLLEPGCTLVSCLPSTSPLQPGVSPLFDSESFLSRLIEVASMRKVKRFAYCSSGGTVYGDQLHGTAREDTKLSPISSYGTAKALAEKVVVESCNRQGVLPLIWRFANLYGPGQRSNSGQGLIATIIGKIHTMETVEIYGDGSMVRDYVHVEDAAFAAACTVDKNPNKFVYNVGSGDGNTVSEVLGLVERLAGIRFRRTFLKKPDGFVERSVLDISLLRSEFPDVGFRSLEDGIFELLRG